VDAHLDAGPTRTTTTRTTSTSQLLVMRTVTQNLDAGEERPVMRSIAKLHIPTAISVLMRNVRSATRTVNALRLSVEPGQQTTELTARVTPVADDVISMSDAPIAMVNASTVQTDPNRPDALAAKPDT
jgi:hypothetical protein